jgi:hypothetical protein
MVVEDLLKGEAGVPGCTSRSECLIRSSAVSHKARKQDAISNCELISNRALGF